MPACWSRAASRCTGWPPPCRVPRTVLPSTATAEDAGRVLMLATNPHRRIQPRPDGGIDRTGICGFQDLADGGLIWQLESTGQRVTADPRAARICDGASATYSPAAVNDLASASTAATAAGNDDVRLRRTSRRLRGSGTPRQVLRQVLALAG